MTRVVSGWPRGGRQRHAHPPPVALPRADAAGFTFVEVLVVLGLTFILLLVALPRFFVPPEADAGLIARQIAGDLGLARRLAIAQGMNFTMSFTPGAGPYTLYTLTDAGGTVHQAFPKELPAAVAVNGPSAITFTPSGAATAAATMTFTAGAAVAQVDVVAATGHIQLTRP